MKLPILFLLVMSAFGQAITLTPSGPANYAASSPFILTVSSTAGTTSTDLSFSVTLPVGVTATAAVPGSAASAAGKSVSCGPSATFPISGLLTCIVYGLNLNTIAVGPVALITLNATTTTPLSLALMNPAAGDTAGNSLSASAGAAATILPPNKCDLNSDGTVNGTDVIFKLNQAKGTTSQTGCDANGDGKCDAVDVDIIVLAALGKGCTAQ